MDAIYGVILEAIFGGDFGGDDSLTYMHFDSWKKIALCKISGAVV